MSRIPLQYRTRIAAALLAFAGCAPAARPAPRLPQPDPEEYRVWGAAIDLDIGPLHDRAFVPVLGDSAEAMHIYAEERRDLLLFRRDSAWARAIESLSSPGDSIPAASLDEWTVMRFARAEIVPRRDTADAVQQRQALGVAHIIVSRVLFDPARRHAAVRVSYICGMVCGHSRIIEFTRDRRRWHKSGGTIGVLF